MKEKEERFFEILKEENTRKGNKKISKLIDLK